MLAEGSIEIEIRISMEVEIERQELVGPIRRDDHFAGQRREIRHDVVAGGIGVGHAVRHQDPVGACLLEQLLDVRDGRHASRTTLDVA